VENNRAQCILAAIGRLFQLSRIAIFKLIYIRSTAFRELRCKSNSYTWQSEHDHAAAAMLVLSCRHLDLEISHDQ
jgi:hypothetical protein